MPAKISIRILIALVLVIILLSAPALGIYKEKVHDNLQQHKSNFTIDNTFFEVRATQTPSRMLMQIGDSIIAVENNTCSDSLNMSICLLNVDYPGEWIHSVFDPYDYSFDIEIYYYLANILITRTISMETFTVGESAKIETTIRNNGSLPASNIVFTDSFPGFFLSNIYNCDKKGKNITWAGELKPNHEKKCSYWITAENTTSFSSIAKAVYNSGIGNRTASSSSPTISITVPKIELDMNLNIENNSLWSGDNTTLSLSLENINSEEKLDSLVISLNIPDSMSILEYSPKFVLSGRSLNWNSRLDPSEKINFSAVLRAEKSGTYPVTVKARYKYGSILRDIEEKENISISIDKMELQDIVYNGTVKPGENASFIINLINPSSRYSFRNIEITAKTNLPVNISQINVNEMLPKRFVNVLDLDLTAPMWEDLTTYTTTFSVNYETKYNEKILLKEERKFVVDPKKPAPQIEAPAAKKTIAGIKIDKEQITEDIKKIGVEKIIIIAAIAIFLFMGSLLNFIKKAQKKVEMYE